LAISLTTRLDEFATAEEQEPSREELYLLVEPDSAGYVVLGPTLRLLEAVHPRLPVTFLDRFTAALNGWVRVYDYRDAQEHVEILKEWVEQEEDAHHYEIPNIEQTVPGCLRNRRPLTAMGLRRVLPEIADRTSKGILNDVMDLCEVASRASRPPISGEMGEQLMDRNPPLPVLLAVFEPHDAVEACFDEEAQGMMEQIPEPNVILPFNGLDCSSVREVFRVLGVLCDTLACASRLIEMMPGNERSGE